MSEYCRTRRHARPCSTPRSRHVQATSTRSTRHDGFPGSKTSVIPGGRPEGRIARCTPARHLAQAAYRNAGGPRRAQRTTVRARCGADSAPVRPSTGRCRSARSSRSSRSSATCGADTELVASACSVSPRRRSCSQDATSDALPDAVGARQSARVQRDTRPLCPKQRTDARLASGQRRARRSHHILLSRAVYQGLTRQRPFVGRRTAKVALECLKETRNGAP